MKKIFILMAAMLLSCTSAFAQNGNNTPAKGDVNGDGTVDVADIVAVIDIMKNGGGTATVGYFYLGTTEPTAENYRSLPGVVTAYDSFDDAVGATVSVAAGETLYLLCPAAWTAGKTPTLEDKDGNAISFLEENDEVTISDYVIYKTEVWNAPNDVVLKTVSSSYFSVGQTAVTSSNYTTANKATTTIPTTFEYTAEARNYGYILIPSSKTLVSVIGKSTGAVIEITEQTNAEISGHKLYKTNGALSVGGTIVITLK